MKTSRLKRFLVSIFAALSLAVSSFAAPLCACLQASAKTHDCCEKMKEHCPMKDRRAKSPARSLDTNSHSGCDCFAEKREPTPTKISENSRAQNAVPALMPSVRFFEFKGYASVAFPFFIARISLPDSFLKQTSARAPPPLVK